MKKRPWLAALLNFVVPGLGYLYNGKRKFFGMVLILVGIASTIDMVYYDWSPPYTILGITSIFIMLLSFGYDAYQDARTLK